MSYDLYFTGRSGKLISKKAFEKYFRGRGNYEVSNNQAIYQNEDTGVYFIFDAPEDGTVAFNLNFFRPHVFGLEAAPELDAFANALEAAVGDPQGGIGEDGEFTREGFLRGWNEGNLFAYRSMLKEQTERIYTWPSERIRRVWEWNYGRRAQQEQVGENLFVPAIFAVELDNGASSVAIWPPDCAILLPAVDGVLMPLTQSGPESQQLALVRWEEVLPVVGAYQDQTAGLARYRLAFESWPDALAEFLAQQRTATNGFKGISFEMVLDQELVEEAGKS